MSTPKADINALIGLIVRGDIRQVRNILNLQPELADEREESSFNTPLHVACSRGKCPYKEKLYFSNFLYHLTHTTMLYYNRFCFDALCCV